jgi:anthranilate phosphoribosyltransferase
VIAGCNGDNLAQVQSVAALCALHNRKTYRYNWQPIHEQKHGHRLPHNAGEQIAGLCAAIFRHDIAHTEFSFLSPQSDYAIDNCGMGGDLVTTPNISTIAAFIAAAHGVKMCKHGSPANADKGMHGSSDFVGLICGIDTYAEKVRVEECVDQFNFGYTEALDARYKRIHLQTHQFAQLPHMNDIIGPITNPLVLGKQKFKIIGVNHVVPPRVVAEALKILNAHGVGSYERVFVIRGYVDEQQYEGIDEVSICAGGTTVVELCDDEITEFTLSADDFEIPEVAQADIVPRGNKGQFSLKILKGEVPGPASQIVCANAALIFMLMKSVENWRDGYLLAERLLFEGDAFEVMRKVQAFVPVKK